MEGEGEEEHERAERRMGLKVHVNMVAAALQVWAPTMAVAVAISSFRYEGGSLVTSSSHLLKVQNNPLQHEDYKEADSHDELWKRETGLFETSIKRLFHIKVYRSFHLRKNVQIPDHILRPYWLYSVQMTGPTTVQTCAYVDIPPTSKCPAPC